MLSQFQDPLDYLVLWVEPKYLISGSKVMCKLYFHPWFSTTFFVFEIIFCVKIFEHKFLLENLFCKNLFGQKKIPANFISGEYFFPQNFFGDLFLVNIFVDIFFVNISFCSFSRWHSFCDFFLSEIFFWQILFLLKSFSAKLFFGKHFLL